MIPKPNGRATYVATVFGQATQYVHTVVSLAADCWGTLRVAQLWPSAWLVTVKVTATYCAGVAARALSPAAELLSQSRTTWLAVAATYVARLTAEGSSAWGTGRDTSTV